MPHGRTGRASSWASGSGTGAPPLGSRSTSQSATRLLLLRYRDTFVVEDIVAQADALVADIDSGSCNEFVHLILALPTERAAQGIRVLRSLAFEHQTALLHRDTAHEIYSIERTAWSSTIAPKRAVR